MRVPEVYVKQNLTPALKKWNQSIRTLRENSFPTVGPKLYFCLPAKLRNTSKCSTDEFKWILEYLAKIPDEPKLPGYTPASNYQYTW